MGGGPHNQCRELALAPNPPSIGAQRPRGLLQQEGSASAAARRLSRRSGSKTSRTHGRSSARCLSRPRISELRWPAPGPLCVPDQRLQRTFPVASTTFGPTHHLLWTSRQSSQSGWRATLRPMPSVSDGPRSSSASREAAPGSHHADRGDQAPPTPLAALAGCWGMCSRPAGAPLRQAENLLLPPPPLTAAAAACSPGR